LRDGQRLRNQLSSLGEAAPFVEKGGEVVQVTSQLSGVSDPAIDLECLPIPSFRRLELARLLIENGQLVPGLGGRGQVAGVGADARRLLVVPLGFIRLPQLLVDLAQLMAGRLPP
jgi:hypothetical protein